MIAYIYQEMDFYADAESAFIPEAPEKEEITGFRYKKRGGYPFLKKLLEEKGVEFEGTLMELKLYSAEVGYSSTHGFLAMLRNLQNLKLISVHFTQDINMRLDPDNAFVHLEITEKGREWVLRKGDACG